MGPDPTNAMLPNMLMVVVAIIVTGRGRPVIATVTGDVNPPR